MVAILGLVKCFRAAVLHRYLMIENYLTLLDIGDITIVKETRVAVVARCCVAAASLQMRCVALCCYLPQPVNYMSLA